MTFDYLFLLNFLFIFIPIILYDVFAGSRKIKYKLPEHLKKKTYASAIFFRVFIAFSIIALAGPRWGRETVVSDNRRGLDVVFAIDVSRSMDIRDAVMQSGTTMSRLERGLLIANESIPETVVESTAAARGVRMAAVIGRSKGYLAVPLAHNNEAVINFLESLDVSSMSGRSTNLEILVETAANVFQSTSMARKIIILISDGESHFGILRNALNHCVKNGIIIASVAVGSDEGR
ncbi:MAG: VWA domain-containing protein, partial [Treponema sp.]|nr:VWA domain-containing protein [Treponema sp.]